MQDSHISTTLSVGYGATDVRYPWPYNHADVRLIRLAATTSFDDIGAVVALACYLSDIAPDESAHNILRQLTQQIDVSLQAQLTLLVNGAPVITTGCCFEVNEWREWYDYLATNHTPWSGHDPAPWIEVHDDNLHVWADGGVTVSDDPAALYIPPILILTCSDYEHLMHALRRDLEEFLAAFARWANTVVPELSVLLQHQLTQYVNLPD